jgi:hypothetical protein
MPSHQKRHGAGGAATSVTPRLGDDTPSRRHPDVTTRAGPVLPGATRVEEANYRFGWGVTRRYGLRRLKPLGNFFSASSSDTAGTTMTSSPSVQFTGVATW